MIYLNEFDWPVYGQHLYAIEKKMFIANRYTKRDDDNIS